MEKPKSIKDRTFASKIVKVGNRYVEVRLIEVNPYGDKKYLIPRASFADNINFKKTHTYKQYLKYLEGVKE